MEFDGDGGFQLAVGSSGGKVWYLLSSVRSIQINYSFDQFTLFFAFAVYHPKYPFKEKIKNCREGNGNEIDVFGQIFN